MENSDLEQIKEQDLLKDQWGEFLETILSNDPNIRVIDICSAITHSCAIRREEFVSVHTYGIATNRDGEALGISSSDVVPDFTPCSALRDRNWFRYHDQANEFRYSDRVIATLAGSLVMWYVLGVGDRHQDNFGLTSLNSFVGIDFSFIAGETPLIDAGDFPVPWMAYKMLSRSGALANFISLCFNAIGALQRHLPAILTAADQYLRDLSLAPEVHVRILQYINSKLSSEITKDGMRKMITKGCWKKLPKDFVHSVLGK